MKKFVEKKHLKKYYAAITGIEKEYRLSKVSKVAAFMYGQDDINIIYADALSRITGKKSVKDNSYSILVSNPPYSVKGFLETLNDADKKRFRLTEFVSDSVKNNAIETFFIERAAQLLCDEGIAGLILPSSILSNVGLYMKCREIMLSSFDIIAIAEFGSGTFGQTGTNTVTLFLRKKKTHPLLDDHYKNRVQSWFHNDTRKDIVFENYHLFEAYCKHIGVRAEDYKTLFNVTGDWKTALGSYELFKEYFAQFSHDGKAKAIQKKKISGKYTKEMQHDELERYIYSSVCQIEQEKLLFFCLAMTNGQEVLVVRSPTATKEMKAFLGYEWSGAKGNEGIKYLGVAAESEDGELTNNKGIQNITTPLFNPSDLEDSTKINTLIRTAFEKKTVIIPDSLKEFVSTIPLHFMLDFNRVKFDKAIKLTADKPVGIQSKYPLVRLGEIAEVVKGQSITAAQTKTGNIKVVAGGIDFAYFHNEANRKAHTITISASGANAGFVNIWREPIFASDCTTVRGKDDLHTLFLYNFLISIQDRIFSLQKGTSQPHVYPDDIKLLQVPDIDVSIQQYIVAECEEVDEEYAAAQKTIEENKRKIEKVFEQLDDAAKQEAGIKLRLSDMSVFDISIGRRVLNLEVNPNYTIPVYSANVFEPFGMIDTLLIEDFSVPSILWGIDGDWMVNIIEANTPFYPTDHCGVLRLKTEHVLPKYMAHLLKKAGEKAGFKRSYRASIDRIKSLTVQAAPIKDQRIALQEIETYEAAITAAKSVLSACADKKKMILEKWL